MSIVHILDPTDARLALALDAQPEATTVGLARRLGLARNTVQARLARLEADCLAEPSRRLPAAALGYPLMAHVSLEISQGDIDATVAGLERIPEVLELHATTGDGDLIARVVARDADDLHRVTRQMLASEGVTRSSTAVALREYIPLRLGPLLLRLLEQEHSSSGR